MSWIPMWTLVITLAEFSSCSGKFHLQWPNLCSVYRKKRICHAQEMVRHKLLKLMIKYNEKRTSCKDYRKCVSEVHTHQQMICLIENIIMIMIMTMTTTNATVKSSTTPYTLQHTKRWRCSRSLHLDSKQELIKYLRDTEIKWNFTIFSQWIPSCTFGITLSLSKVHISSAAGWQK